MDKEIKGRKNIIASVVLVMTVVLLAAISALVIGSVLDAEVFSGTSGLGSDTLTSVDNITSKSLSILLFEPTASCVLTSVENATGTSISSGNYTLPTSCSIISTDESEYISQNWVVNYTWSTDGAAGSVINITELTDGFSGFVSGIVIFLAVIGIIVGVMWLVSYIRPLFSKDQGIQGFEAN